MDHEQSKVLLLGMVNTLPVNLLTKSQVRKGENIIEPNFGQEYRDKIRINGLITLGYLIYTLDSKHPVERAIPGTHCNASFLSNRRRLEKNIIDTWGPRIKFACIILDYFFSPVSLVNCY